MRKTLFQSWRKNLRVPGQMNADGSRVITANGERHGRGIYAATEFGYGRPYAQGASEALLCLALPGVVSRAKKITEPLPSGDLPDSICHGPVRV